MIFMTKREFEEEVYKRIEEARVRQEQEQRYWELRSEVDGMKAKFRKLEEMLEVKVKEDPIPMDNAFMEHG